MIPATSVAFNMASNEETDMPLPGRGYDRGNPSSILGQGHALCSSPSPQDLYFPHRNDAGLHPMYPPSAMSHGLSTTPPPTAPLQSPFAQPHLTDYPFPSTTDPTPWHNLPPGSPHTGLAVSMDAVNRSRSGAQTRSTNSLSGEVELGYALTTPTTGLLYTAPQPETSSPDEDMDVVANEMRAGNGGEWTSDSAHKLRALDQTPTPNQAPASIEIDQHHQLFAQTGLTPYLAAFPDGTAIAPLKSQSSNPSRPGPLRTLSASASLPSRRHRSSTSLSIASASPVPAPASASVVGQGMRNSIGMSLGMTPATAIPHVYSSQPYPYQFPMTPVQPDQSADTTGANKRVIHPSPSSSASNGERTGRSSLDAQGDKPPLSLGLTIGRGVRSASSASSGTGLGLGSVGFGSGQATGTAIGPRPGDGKPPRFKPTKEQLDVLIATYEGNKNPDAPTREALAKRLGPDIRPKTLQIWFQNRRSKARAKERTEHGDGEGHHGAKRGPKAGKERIAPKRSSSDTFRRVSYEALRALVHDEDPRLELVPVSVVMISNWTRVLTPGSGWTKPDLGVSLHLDTAWSTSTSSMSASASACASRPSASPPMMPSTSLNPHPAAGGNMVLPSPSVQTGPPQWMGPSLKIHVSHNDEAFRITIPLAVGTVDGVRMSNKVFPGSHPHHSGGGDDRPFGADGEQNGQGRKWSVATNHNVAAVEFVIAPYTAIFHRWKGGEWSIHGDFTGGGASGGGACEISGDAEVIASLCIKMQSILVSSPYSPSLSGLSGVSGGVPSLEYFYPLDMTKVNASGFPVAPLSAPQLYAASLSSQVTLPPGLSGFSHGHTRKRSISQPVPVGSALDAGESMDVAEYDPDSGRVTAYPAWQGTYPGPPPAAHPATSLSEDGHSQPWSYPPSQQLPTWVADWEAVYPYQPLFQVPTYQPAPVSGDNYGGVGLGLGLGVEVDGGARVDVAGGQEVTTGGAAMTMSTSFGSSSSSSDGGSGGHEDHSTRYNTHEEVPNLNNETPAVLSTSAPMMHLPMQMPPPMGLSMSMPINMPMGMQSPPVPVPVPGVGVGVVPEAQQGGAQSMQGLVGMTEAVGVPGQVQAAPGMYNSFEEGAGTLPTGGGTGGTRIAGEGGAERGREKSGSRVGEVGGVGDPFGLAYGGQLPN